VTRLSEPYGVIVTGSAEKDLARLPEKYREAVWERIHGPIADNPHRLGRRFTRPGPLQGLWRNNLAYPSGEAFRIVYAIEDDRREVTILRVGHRDKVYDRW
jgi:mRNA-degrading endonuclease RelE of RelBE toxin-antitoxin system